MAPAAAQVPGGLTDTGPALNLRGEGMHRKTDGEVNQERDRESAYKSGMSKIPDKKVKNDPWGVVRTTPAKYRRPDGSDGTQTEGSLRTITSHDHQKVRLFRAEEWPLARSNPIWCKTFSS